MKYSKELTRSLHQSLPEEIRDAIASQKTLDSISEIADKHKLDGNQWKKLEYEITLLLLGLTKADNFTNTLVQELGIAQELASAVAVDTHQKILSRIPEERLHAQEEYAHAKLAEAGESAFMSDETAIEVASEIHPAVEPGEFAHDVPHVEQPATASVQQTREASVTQEQPEPIKTEATNTYSYPSGKDPYREPIE